MPPAHTAASATGAATATNTITSGTLGRFGGMYSSVYALTAYNGAFVTNPATDANYGGEVMGLVVGKQGAAGNCSIECWAITKPTTTSGTVTMNWALGTIQDMIMSAVEVQWAGIAVAPAGIANGANGTVTPLTMSITATTYPGGRTASAAVDPTSNLLLSMGCLFRAASGSNLSITSGNEIMVPTNSAAGATQIQAASAFFQGTGGTDTISWSESVNREWAQVILEIAGAAMDGMVLRAPGMIPSAF